MKALNGKVSDLEKAAAQRKAKLDENSAFLQFNWKADVVESWIGEHQRGGRGQGSWHWAHGIRARGQVRQHSHLLP